MTPQKTDMPDVIYVRPQPHGGWHALEDNNSTKFDGDVQYIRAKSLEPIGYQFYKHKFNEWSLVFKTELDARVNAVQGFHEPIETRPIYAYVAAPDGFELPKQAREG